MCRLACGLLIIAWPSSVWGQIVPDQLLTIPHILRTPVISDFALAPDGKRVALSISVAGKQTLFVVPGDDPEGGAFSTTHGLAERDVDWSPDGSQIAFVSGRGDDGHIFVSDPKGLEARQLTRHAGSDRRPRFSPDGKTIAFLVRRADTTTGWDLWTIPAAGGEAVRLTSMPFDEDDPRWSPDGNELLFAFDSGHHASRKIGIIAASGGESRFLLPETWTGDSFGARWSPDGKKVVFVSDEHGWKSIYSTPAAGGKPQQLIESPFELTEPAWSPDGRYLTYVENREGNLRLKLYDLEKDRDRTLTLRAGVHSQPVWRPDSSAVLSLYEAWNYSRDVWAYEVEGGREKISNTLPLELDVRKMVRPELIRYESFDGREITGFLYLPPSANSEEPVSLLVRPHGGPTSQWLNAWHPFTQLLVQHGFGVFAPNVRGSTGFGIEFEALNDGNWGQGDLEDLIAGARFVASRPDVRNDRIGIWGVSYGGFLALAALGRYPDFFACAIEALGMTDLEKLYRETTEEGRSYLEREIGPLRGNLNLYRELSPIRQVREIQTPLLSFHGERYPLVPYETKKPFVDALRARPNFPLTELIFKGEEARATYRHDLHPEAAWAYVEKILEFLEIYL